MLIQHIQHMLPVLHKYRQPHGWIALGQPHGTFKTTSRQLEDGTLLLFFLQDGVRQGKRSDMRNMADVGSMHIMIGGIHIYHMHSQQPVYMLDLRYCLRIAVLLPADDTSPA